MIKNYLQFPHYCNHFSQITENIYNNVCWVDKYKNTTWNKLCIQSYCIFVILIKNIAFTTAWINHRIYIWMWYESSVKQKSTGGEICATFRSTIRMQQAFPIAQSEARVNFFDHHTIIYQNKTFLDIIIFIANRSSAVTVTGMPQEDITVALAETNQYYSAQLTTKMSFNAKYP